MANPIAQSPTLAIQQAMYAAASADSELTGTLGADVYDEPPEGAKRPYVVFENLLTTPDNRHGAYGWQTVVTLAVWVEKRGYTDAHLIKSRLIELFDHQPLDVAGFHHVETRHELDQELRDPNPKLRRSLLRLRVITEQEG